MKLLNIYSPLLVYRPNKATSGATGDLVELLEVAYWDQENGTRFINKGSPV